MRHSAPPDGVGSERAIRVLVVDDEAPARDRLTSLIQAEPDFEVVSSCENGRRALADIESLHPEVVFLDIQMPGLGGFDVVQRMETSPLPLIVFVTAFDEHAVAAFEASALDYLLKPYSRRRLAGTLDRVRDRLSRRGPPLDREWLVREVLGALSTEDGGTSVSRVSGIARIPVRDRRRTTFVEVADIFWVEAKRNYVRLHTAERQPLVRSTLTAMLDKLGSGFARIHHSYAVRLAEVVEVRPQPGGGYEVVLSNGTRLNTSERYRGQVQQMLRF